jgi:integrase
MRFGRQRLEHRVHRLLHQVSRRHEPHRRAQRLRDGVRLDGGGRVEAGSRDGVSAHALRATCASQAFERAKDLRVAQELLGHTNLAVTSRYIRPAGVEALREALGGWRYRGAQ